MRGEYLLYERIHCNTLQHIATQCNILSHPNIPIVTHSKYNLHCVLLCVAEGIFDEVLNV